MTKTCGKCGHAALDDQALFCNRCGADVAEETKPAFPICPSCGTVVSDMLALFCNRCGSKIPAVPAICSSCGTQAVDGQSRFCTRCGTTFDQKTVIRTPVCPSCGAPDPQGRSLYCNRCGTPFGRLGSPAVPPQGQQQVIVSQKKGSAHHPSLIVPDSDWEPWNDEPPAPIHPIRPVPEQTPVDQQPAISQKRYAHLPLVAEELKKGKNPERIQIKDGVTVQKKRSGSQKKGVLGFLKK